MPNVMDENTEYLLVFTITSGQDNVYYYSRIMQTDGKAAAKVVEFAKKFHDETFIKDDKSFLQHIWRQQPVTEIRLHMWI